MTLASQETTPSPTEQSQMQAAKVRLRKQEHVEALAILDDQDSPPDTDEFHTCRGLALAGMNRWGEAERAFARAFKLNPEPRGAWINLASSRINAAAYAPAIKVLNGMLERWPDDEQGLYLLANALKDCGQVSTAITLLQKLLAKKPAHRDAQSNLLVCLNCVTDDPQALLRAHRGVALEIPKALTKAETRRAEITDKPLTIGYLSSDFRRHAVATFFRPILEGHNPDRVRVICFSDTTQVDDVTDALQRVTLTHRNWNWRRVEMLSDQDLIECIQADEVDILVELNGHTEGNRLPVLKARAAPLQATYLGYPCTTGMENVDLRLTDCIADPEGEDGLRATEQLVRLPNGFHAFSPPMDAPEVGPLPAMENGHVTFGCCNNVSKITPAQLETWAKILSEVPGSRLCILD